MGKFKKIRIFAAIGLVSMGIGVEASASDGVITFTGRITSQTCTINGGQPEFSVLFPLVAVQGLNASGVTTGRTPFRINLTECDEDLDGVGVYFSTGENGSLYGTKILNQGTATNIELQLLNNELVPMKLSPEGEEWDGRFVALSNRAAMLSYVAEYYAVGVRSSGTVEGSAQYTVVYP